MAGRNSRSPTRRATVGQGSLLQEAQKKELLELEDTEDLSVSFHSNSNNDESASSRLRTGSTSEEFTSESKTRDLTPPRRSSKGKKLSKSKSVEELPVPRRSVYNRQLTPSKSAIRRKKKPTKKKGIKKNVSFSEHNMEIPPEEFPEDDDESGGSFADDDEEDQAKRGSTGSSSDGSGDDIVFSMDGMNDNSAPDYRRTASNDSVRSSASASSTGSDLGSIAEEGMSSSSRRSSSARVKLTPQERAAKREQALKEAKAAAQKVKGKSKGTSFFGMTMSSFGVGGKKSSSKDKDSSSKKEAAAEQAPAAATKSGKSAKNKAQSAAAAAEEETAAAPKARPKPVKAQSARAVVDKANIRNSRKERIAAARAASARKLSSSVH